ncbi:uncharacterized protein LOC103951368 [Pyrus x bretschneideri]|uniref:uncharacterized protein LOC103951368 n=1 Tax=Pyrus x bretschneideri TaxID=225117 RepID=UPI00202FAE1D|nr:uncharacterized protein LOC103951368 [Pyrus x bretschneideri]
MENHQLGVLQKEVCLVHATFSPPFCTCGPVAAASLLHKFYPFEVVLFQSSLGDTPLIGILGKLWCLAVLNHRKVGRE